MTALSVSAREWLQHYRDTDACGRTTQKNGSVLVISLVRLNVTRAVWLATALTAAAAMCASCQYVSGLAALELGGGDSADAAPPSDGGDSLNDADVDARTDASSATDARVDADAAPPVVPPSCVALGSVCGASNAGESCCTSNVVPGGSYRRFDILADAGPFEATVSDFRLDVYEVTVGRFRKFLEAGKGTKRSAPPAGAGTRVGIANSGWNATEWNIFLPEDTAALRGQLAETTCPTAPSVPVTWTDAPGANESKPQNCLTWFEAFAFCVWDGGFLPTEAEWNYAGAGGSEQREYPWGTGANSLLAVYAGESPQNVGSKPGGRARWGQLDVGGNLWEWNLDTGAAYPTTCTNCANTDTSPYRVIRGGATSDDGVGMLNSFRTGAEYKTPVANIGARCARER
jgi:formylglycine-generating enzyme